MTKEISKIVEKFKKSEPGTFATTSEELTREIMDKIKKQFESKPNSKRTQQDIDQYNKAVNDINAALGKFNSSMTEMNKQGVSALNDWNKTYNKYMDEHMPKQQRN